MSVFSTTNKKTLILTTALSGLFALALPGTASAGFDWTPPPAKAVPAMPAGKSAPDLSGPLTPEPDAVLPVPVGKVDGAKLAPAAAPAPTSKKNTDNVAPVDADAQPLDPLAAPPLEAVPTGMKTVSTVSAAKPTDAAPVPVAPIPAEDVAADQGMDSMPLPAASPAPAPAPDVQSIPAPKEQIVWANEKAAPTTDRPLQGFGKAVPLAMALRQIVPANYAFQFSSPNQAGVKISWQGGKPWKAVLQESLASAGLAADIQNNVVVIRSAAAAPAPAPTPAATASADKPMDLSTAAPTSTAKPVLAPTVQSWMARPGATVKDVLTEWSKAAHVELKWMSPYDYPVGTAFTHQGTFNEAVDSLLSLYSRENPRPRGRLYPNLPEGPSVLMIN